MKTIKEYRKIQDLSIDFQLKFELVNDRIWNFFLKVVFRDIKFQTKLISLNDLYNPKNGL